MTVDGKAKSECCGCNACAEICPRKCIQMTCDSFGFLYPGVDMDSCIHCGLCEKVCPFSASDAHLPAMPMKCYAARRHIPASQSGSSSGGAATAICKKVIENGGVAYGCASDGLGVAHIRVENLQDLPKLQGSKYVQSDTRGIYSRVKADLDGGRKVVFIGSPCQTFGLSEFLRKDFSNLLLVDIICHGVPSQQMLSDHASHVTKGQPVSSMSFRTGTDYVLKLHSGQKEVWAANAWAEPKKDLYYRAFLQGLNYRPSCYNCKFAGPKRYSDITIGDFWGLADKTLFDNTGNMGTSVILANTDRGNLFINGLRDELEMYERDVREAIDGNTQLRHAVKQQKSSKLFFRLYPRLKFDTAMRIAYNAGDTIAWIKKAIRYGIGR